MTDEEILEVVETYRPIFVGYTADEKKLVVYRKDGNTTDFFIQRPTDGQLWALSPGSSIDWFVDHRASGETMVAIQSPEWTGTVHGSRYDALKEPTR